MPLHSGDCQHNPPHCVSGGDDPAIPGVAGALWSAHFENDAALFDDPLQYV
ncbi:MAG: hypothetical protein ACXABY_16310 [Candidatus Thorarchaeota archaeon]